jgi:arginyl-tRNA--protein-N-Asp/Glu arginylyltransferase
MNQVHELPFAAIQFYATAPYKCSYLPDQMARSQVAAPGYLIHAGTYSALVDQGFRRSGLYTYRPHCDQCKACLPIRLDCQRFKPNRSQQRAWKRHCDLEALIKPLAWSEEHFDLYLAYQRTRHPGGGMDDDSRSQYSQFLLASRVNSRLVEFRDTRQTLQMVSIIDVLEQGLSSVYTFYNPHLPGSLGTYGILWQLQQCQSLQLPWLYLGYWIEQSQKMSYKSRFQPAQYLYQGQWHNTPPDTRGTSAA